MEEKKENRNLFVMIEFKIRAYGRMELAQLYSPELTGIAAYRKMNKWIVRCPGLQERPFPHYNSALPALRLQVQ